MPQTMTRISFVTGSFPRSGGAARRFWRRKGTHTSHAGAQNNNRRARREIRAARHKRKETGGTAERAAAAKAVSTGAGALLFYGSIRQNWPANVYRPRRAPP